MKNKILVLALAILLTPTLCFAVTKTPAKDITTLDTTTSCMGSTDVQSCLNAITVPVVLSTKTSAYTITTADRIILGDTTASAFAVTLPTAVGNKIIYTVKRIGSGSNNLTIATTSAQTIDGDSTAILTRPNTSLDIYSDNSNWRIK